MLPKAAAAAVQARIPFAFGVHDFTAAAQSLDIGRPRTGSREQLPKSPGFCVYSPAFSQFVYRPKLVDRMVPRSQQPKNTKNCQVSVRYRSDNVAPSRGSCPVKSAPSVQCRFTGSRDTPKSCQSSPAILVNLCSNSRHPRPPPRPSFGFVLLTCATDVAPSPHNL